MDPLALFSITPISLLLFAAVPVLYLVIQIRWWYNSKALRLGNFLFSSLAVILASIVIVKNGQDPADLSVDEVMLTIAHLLPLGVVFLSLQHSRVLHEAYRLTFGTTDSPSTTTNPTDYQPVPLNSMVERVSWNELVINAGLREELISIIELLKEPRTAMQYGISLPKGILFSGPPGTGKTTIAKVIANTANLAFFVLRADEVVSRWVGDSEKNLSRLFAAAQRHAPAVIFIDEIDAIGKSRTGESVYQDNLLNHLLQLIDGVVRTDGLYIIGATNRPDLVDEALKRAGRLNRSIKIPLPDFQSRMQLFALYLNRLKLTNDIPLQALANITAGKSCADIKEICNQAGLNAFKRESLEKTRTFTVTIRDIELALEKVLASS